MWQEMGRRKGRDSRHGEGDTANIYFKGKGPAIEVVAHLTQQVIFGHLHVGRERVPNLK